MSTPPKPHGERAAPSYTRFIPREELRGFAAWTPDALAAADGAGGHGHGAGNGSSAAGPAPADTAQGVAEALQAQLHAARQAGYQAGYQDGYRDGLAALDAFKRSYAQQTSAQVGALLRRLDADLLDLERALAQTVAQTAAELARQVVRSELATRPQLVARVAEDALAEVLLSARHIRVHLHPDDLALVEHGAAEALAGRGARLVASADVERGGCRVESDLGAVDARIATRWAQAAAALGAGLPWTEAASGPAGAEALSAPDPAAEPVVNAGAGADATAPPRP
jgi:flagellar assembly protein FliH